MADDIASTAGNEPGAVLIATSNELWLKGKRGSFRIPRLSVVKVCRGGLYPWFFKGIRIRHQLSALPSNIQFASFHVKTGELIAKLHSLGYPTA